MNISAQEVSDVKNFIDTLNAKKDSAVIVEGKRDVVALKSIGFSGKVLTFHKFGGFAKFIDSVAKYNRLIVLFDSDRKGRFLTGKVVKQLERRTKIDLSFKKKLISITRGKIRFIEELYCYRQFLI